MLADALFDLGKFIFDFVMFVSLGPGVLLVFVRRLVLRGSLERFFIYEKRSGFFYNLDPRAKIFFSFAITFLGSSLGSPLLLLALFGWSVLMWAFAHPSRDKALTAFVFLLPIMVTGPLYQSMFYQWNWNEKTFFIPVTVVYTLHPAMNYIIGGYIITVEGFQYGAFQALRVLIASSSGLLIAATTAPNALLLGLTNFVKIRKIRIGLPYILSFALVTAIRIVPSIFEDASTVINAQKARGLVLAARRTRNPVLVLRGIARIMRSIASILTPVVISSLRRGGNLATAADIRAFRATPNRTYLIERNFSKTDWAFFLFTLAILIAGSYWAATGHAAYGGGVI